MPKRTRDLSLYSIAAVAYLLASNVETGLEDAVCFGLPLSCVAVGLFIGLLPRWGWGSLYVVDVLWTAQIAFVSYPRSVARFTMVIEGASLASGFDLFPASQGAPLDPLLVNAFIRFVVAMFGYGYLKGWIKLDHLKHMATVFGIAFFTLIPALAYFWFSLPSLLFDPNVAEFMQSNPVVMAEIFANALVISNLWLVLFAPFVAYAFFRYLKVYQKLAGVGVHGYS